MNVDETLTTGPTNGPSKSSIKIIKEINGQALAIAIEGAEYHINGITVGIPQYKVADLALASFPAVIVVDFPDTHADSIAFRAIQHLTDTPWEAVVMVRENIQDGKDRKRVTEWVRAFEQCIKKRQQTEKDVTFLIKEIGNDWYLVSFTVRANGALVREFLDNARVIVEEMIASVS